MNSCGFSLTGSCSTANPNAVHFLDGFLGQHFFRRSVAVDFPVAQHHQTGKEQRSEVEIVQRGDDGQAALAVEPAQKLEDLDLMFEIEKGGRLVEQKDLRLLGQGARDYHPLFFAAAQLVEITVGEERRESVSSMLARAISRSFFPSRAKAL